MVKKRHRPGTFVKGDPRAGRPKGVRNKATDEAKTFCASLVEDPDYQQAFKRAFIARKLPPRLEEMVWHYAKGRPPQSVEVGGLGGEPITFEVVTNVPEHAD